MSTSQKARLIAQYAVNQTTEIIKVSAHSGILDTANIAMAELSIVALASFFAEVYCKNKNISGKIIEQYALGGLSTHADGNKLNLQTIINYKNAYRECMVSQFGEISQPAAARVDGFYGDVASLVAQASGVRNADQSNYLYVMMVFAIKEYVQQMGKENIFVRAAKAVVSWLVLWAGMYISRLLIGLLVFAVVWISGLFKSTFWYWAFWLGGGSIILWAFGLACTLSTRFVAKLSQKISFSTKGIRYMIAGGYYVIVPLINIILIATGNTSGAEAIDVVTNVVFIIMGLFMAFYGTASALEMQ